MKFLHALVITAAALTAAPAAFSHSDLATPEAAVNKCKRVKASLVEVCNTYMAQYNASYTLYRQFQADRLTIKHIRAHMLAANSLVRTMYRNRSVDVVAKSVNTFETTIQPVLKQLKPLAKEWDNYKELQARIGDTFDNFHNATSSWMTAKTGSVSCDKVKKSVKNVCKAYQSHFKAVSTYISRLKVDGLSAKLGQAHNAALTAVYKDVYAGKKSKAKAKVKKLDETTVAVVKEIGPLAEEWDNYKAMAKDILETKGAFDKALNKWMGK